MESGSLAGPVHLSKVWLFGRWVGLDVLSDFGKMSVTCVDTLLLALGVPHTVFLGPSILLCSDFE